MPPALDHIHYQVDGAVARIELSRPEVLNAFAPKMGLELSAALDQARTDPAVRAVLLTGAGRAFSAGADLRAPREVTLDGRSDLQTRLRAIYNPLIMKLVRLCKPVVCGVQGPAAGIGASIALACDVLIASESAYFLLAFVRIGLIPDGGVLLLMSHKIGLARTLRLALLGERLSAPRASEWGLLEDVVPDDELHNAAVELARRLANGPTVAYGNLKRAANMVLLRDLAQQLELEASLQQGQGTTHDYQEGLAAFLEHREPHFTGC